MNGQGSLFLKAKNGKRPLTLSTGGRIHVARSQNGILSGRKKEWSPDTCSNMDEPCIMLSERSQTQKIAQCVIHSCGLSRLDKSTETGRRLAVARGGEGRSWVGGLLLGMIKCSKTDYGDGPHNSVNIPETIELCGM